MTTETEAQRLAKILQTAPEKTDLYGAAYLQLSKADAERAALELLRQEQEINALKD